jgi:hypothetical protein
VRLGGVGVAAERNDPWGLDTDFRLRGPILFGGPVVVTSASRGDDAEQSGEEIVPASSLRLIWALLPWTVLRGLGP